MNYRKIDLSNGMVKVPTSFGFMYIKESDCESLNIPVEKSNIVLADVKMDEPKTTHYQKEESTVKHVEEKKSLQPHSNDENVSDAEMDEDFFDESNYELKIEVVEKNPSFITRIGETKKTVSELTGFEYEIGEKKHYLYERRD